MKTKLFFLTSVILGMLAAGCQDDTLQDEPAGKGKILPSVNMEDLSAAMQWYEMHQMEQYATRAGKRHPLFEEVIPDWPSSYSGENGEGRTVETYLGVLNPGIYVTEEASRAYRETQDPRYLKALSRLVVLFPEEDGEAMGFYMTIVPSKSYLEKTDFRPFANNSYTVRDKELDGYVLYHGLDGQLINGWVYEKGKITLAIYGGDPVGDATPQTRAGTMMCIPHYEQYCTDYFYSVNGGDPIYNGTSCTEPILVSMDCSSTGSDGVVPGGGGGGVGNLPQPGSSPAKYAERSGDKFAKKNLPRTMTTQLNNGCVPAIMEYLDNKVFGGTTNQGVYNMYFFETQGYFIYTDGVPKEIVPDLVEHFFNTTDYTSYKDAIDKGFTVMTNMPSTFDGSPHNILIVGYQDNGRYIYMDPELGEWNVVKESYFSKNYNLVITGVK